MKCDVDIRKDLYAKVVLSDSVAMLQGRDQMTKECNVSYADDFFCFRNSGRRSQLEHKVGPAQRECQNAHRLDTVTLAHLILLSLSCCVHFITLPTHSRWLKLRRKTDFHLTVSFCVCCV